MPEKQDIEWKQEWNDEYLKWICGFANAQGGTIYIGIDDKGNVTGLKDSKKLLEDIPNKIKNGMGIIADVNLHEKDGEEYIEICVNSYTFPVSYNGKYYKRSGSTRQELVGHELDEFILKKQGVTWDSVPVPGVTIDDLDQSAVKVFKKKALESHRLDKKALNVSNELLFQNLHLFSGEYLKKAAILLFHENPENWIQGAYIKIGFFGASDSELIYQDEIHGPLIKQVDTAIDMIYTKYLKALIDYEGIQRTETYMMPKEGFREILLNSVNHKDYSRGVPIQISVYEDKIYVWNDGKFPETLSVDTIYEKHSSIPYNPQIADVLFKSGMIESWGRGFDKIKEECEMTNTPLPEYKTSERGVMVKCFPCEKYMELATKYSISNENVTNNVINNVINKELKKHFLGKKLARMEKIVDCIIADNSVTTEYLSQITGVNTRTISRDIDALRECGIIDREGSRIQGKWKVLITNE